MPKVCLLDLDGVIVDFVQGAFDLHKKSIPMAEVRWDFMPQIGIAPEDFWKPMGQEFWCKLPFTREGPNLIEALESRFGENVVLLTSPCGTQGGTEGKVDWIKKHLPKYKRRFFVGPPKHFLAGHGKLLIDDYDANVSEFMANGGSAITVPRPWNGRRSECIDGHGFDIAQVLNEVDLWLKYA